MAKHWYCKIAGKERGPLSSSELKELVANGELQPEDPIRQGEEGKWTAAHCVKGLFPGRTASPTIPPPLPTLPQTEEKEAAPSPPSPEVAPEQTSDAGATIPPVLQVDASPKGAAPSPKKIVKATLSLRQRQQKRTQILALVLLVGVVALGVILVLVFTGVLGPGRSVPEKPGKPAVEANDDSTEPDAAPKEVENK